MYRILIHKALISSAIREIYLCINFTHGDVKLTAKKGDDWANYWSQLKLDGNVCFLNFQVNPKTHLLIVIFKLSGHLRLLSLYCTPRHLWGCSILKNRLLFALVFSMWHPAFKSIDQCRGNCDYCRVPETQQWKLFPLGKGQTTQNIKSKKFQVHQYDETAHFYRGL